MSVPNSEQLIHAYVDGWVNKDSQQILDTLASDCLIIESHGPTYHGIDKVKEWIDQWFDAGHIVNQWEINSLHCVVLQPQITIPARKLTDYHSVSGVKYVNFTPNTE